MATFNPAIVETVDPTYEAWKVSPETTTDDYWDVILGEYPDGIRQRALRDLLVDSNIDHKKTFETLAAIDATWISLCSELILHEYQYPHETTESQLQLRRFYEHAIPAVLTYPNLVDAAALVELFPYADSNSSEYHYNSSFYARYDPALDFFRSKGIPENLKIIIADKIHDEIVNEDALIRKGKAEQPHWYREYARILSRLVSYNRTNVSSGFLSNEVAFMLSRHDTEPISSGDNVLEFLKAIPDELLQHQFVRRAVIESNGEGIYCSGYNDKVRVIKALRERFAHDTSLVDRLIQIHQEILQRRRLRPQIERERKERHKQLTEELRNSE